MSHSFSPSETKRAGIRVQANCSGFSLTQQHHRDECDITRIISRYARTGELPPGKQNAVYGDVTHLQGDVTALREHAATVISTAESDLQNFRQKQISEQEKTISEQKQKILLQQQKLQRLSDLKSELAALEGPPSTN